MWKNNQKLSKGLFFILGNPQMEKNAQAKTLLLISPYVTTAKKALKNVQNQHVSCSLGNPGGDFEPPPTRIVNENRKNKNMARFEMH